MTIITRSPAMNGVLVGATSVAAWLAVAGILNAAIPPYVESTPDAKMCNPQLFGSDNDMFQGRYPIADDAFDRRRYSLAYRAYYQYFFCRGGEWTTVNLQAEDLGAAGELRVALTEAAAGNYASAVIEAKKAADTPGGFGEANFITGDLMFSLGKRHAARVQWRRATEVIPMTPSSTPAKATYALAAEQMLRRH